MNDKPRILFVDDEPYFLDGIRRMLRRHAGEWELAFTGSVAGALRELGRAEFDLLVTDINMPGRNGFDLLAAVCGENPEQAPFPIVVLTGNAETDLKRRALEMGATDLLNKPVSAPDLVARVRSALRLKSYQDQIREQNELLEKKVAERTADLEISRLDILWRLAKAGEYRDEETGNHTVRVGLLSHTLARALGMERDLAERVFLVSPLHDIGKIGIPDGILLKKGALTPEEWKIMRTHCQIGFSILKDEAKGTGYYLDMICGADGCGRARPRAANPLLDTAAVIALNHHERWDGQGYPQGLRGGEIPLVARIVALVDVFDALKSVRPYKPAFSDDKTLEIIREERGGHFAPQIVEAFLDTFDVLREICLDLQDEAAILAT